MAEKGTTMRLKVDLQCEKCYKKVKKVLCKFPEIRDQEFDEKKNIVTIKVVCCSPEKLRDMLCCKGCGAIKSIEIVEPPNPKPSQKTDPAHKEPEDTKGQPSPQKPPDVVLVPIGTCCVPCSKGRPGGPCVEGCGRTCCVPCSKGRPSGPCFEGYGRTCCGPCSEGRPGGPCFVGYGRPPPCYEGYFYVRPVHDIRRGGRPCAM